MTKFKGSYCCRSHWTHSWLSGLENRSSKI